MPFDFNEQRANIASLRQTRQDNNAQLRDNDLLLRAKETERNTLLRTGADVSELAAEIDQLSQTRRGLLEAATSIEGNVTALIDNLLIHVQPEDMFNGLDGQVPLALLPVRLETRFFNANQELRIRIYPDAIHLHKHFPELTEQEVERGQWYWNTRLAGDATAGDAAWAGLTLKISPPRAAYIVQTLRPTNLQPDDTLPLGEAPVFPEVVLRAARSIPTPHVTTLPDRWVAIGLKEIAQGQFQPMFRQWGKTVPDTLNFGPSFERLIPISDDKEQLPIDAEMRWLTDYDEAKARGMAITIQAQHMLDGHRLDEGIDLLMVLGVDWTLTPEEGAVNFGKLLDAHQHADGLAFVPQGTPTNNTTSQPSGFTTEPTAYASQFNPAKSPTVNANSASSRLSMGLGLSENDVNLHRSAYAGLREQQTTSFMIDALWQGTAGYYLNVLLEPFVTDRMFDLARDHAVKYLQPFGPYTTMRLGKQPYGVLPVIARRFFKPDLPDGVELALNQTLEAAATFWRQGVSSVPYMPDPTNAENDIDTEMLSILQMTPVSSSLNYRLIYDTEVLANSASDKDHRFERLDEKRFIQDDILRSLVLPIFASYTGWNFPVTEISHLWAHFTSRPLPVAWVQPTPPKPDTLLEQNYIQDIIDLVNAGGAGRQGLNNKTRSTFALLEMLLGLAALYETGQASDRLIRPHEVNPNLEAAVKSTLKVSSVIGVYPVEQQNPLSGVYIQTHEQQANLIVPALTGHKIMADFVIDRLNAARDTPEVRNLASFIDSLEDLKTRPSAELDRTLRGVLDCYAYRFDAWATSLASRRLDHVRASKPQGLHIGGYGWVEKLKPDVLPNTLGYVHTPSLNHAVTAAVLRSGYLSHQAAGDSDAATLNIDLSSERVRLGLALLEGVGQDQPLSALLGYRFERGLRDRGLTYARFILPFRKLAPYGSSVAIDPTPNENIAARDVVDGVVLIERWHAEGRALIPLLQMQGQPLTPPTDEETMQLVDELKRLDASLDAVSDLLTAEAMFQLVRGNYERAGAALSAIDRQTHPPEIEFVHTPRSGVVYTQRALLVLQTDALSEGWEGTPLDLRAQLEPRLNAWISSVIGNPQTYVLTARSGLQTQVENEAPTVVWDDVLLTARISDLQLSPLSLVMTNISPQNQKPSELELRLAHIFAAQIADPQPNTVIELLTTAPQDSDMPGLGELRVLLDMLHTFIAKRRAIDARDFYPAEGEPLPGYDIADLQARWQLAHDRFDAMALQVTAALANPTVEALRSVLVVASEVGMTGAVPDIVLDDETAQPLLQSQMEQIDRIVKTVAQQITDLETAFEHPAEAERTYQALMSDHYIACIRLIFGEDFPVLPRFLPANQVELQASQAEQAALTRNDSFAPLTWLSQLASVRPELDKLASLLTAIDLLGHGLTPQDYRVTQLPHVSGQQWIALLGSEARPLLSLVTIGSYDLNSPIAGLIADGWSEMIPAAKETTGITFHYDAPAARPPQVVLLAVPPDLTQPHWTFDAVFETILSTWELMKLRGVGPQQISTLSGRMLPALYMPLDNSLQIPSVDFSVLSKTFVSEAILGKFMQND